MAAAATKPSSSSASKRQPRAAKKRRASAGASATNKAAGASATKKAAAKPVKKVVSKPAAKAVSKPAKKLAKGAARKAASALMRKAAEAGAGAVRRAADRGAQLSHGAVEAAVSRRLPIQVSIDVAVPIAVAWEEWMGSGVVIEGIHRIEEVERDGKLLFGTLAGPRPTDWEAEVVDERPEQSFAWRSQQGSDCAGLVTFHELSERLTRIELDLDVLPTNPLEAASLSLHLAHRRAEADLRRFKAHVE